MVVVGSGGLGKWIRNEIEFPGVLQKGSRGNGAKRVQEWLNLHGLGVVIDSHFGKVTGAGVARFQSSLGLAETGVVDEETFSHLVSPMTEILESPLEASMPLGDAVIAFATAHFNQHPREVGGQNRGPWVRLYMNGNDGVPWAWCAGFVTFVLRQACEAMEAEMPLAGSFSCDSLAAQAKAAHLFVSARDVEPDAIPSGSVFMVRRTKTDWTHTGFVSHAWAAAFDTIEGNTNDDGHREGYEVCARMRGYAQKDFVVLG